MAEEIRRDGEDGRRAGVTGSVDYQGDVPALLSGRYS